MARRMSAGWANPGRTASSGRPPSATLLSFFDKAGRAIYGVRWKPDLVSHLASQLNKRAPAGSDAALALAVRDLILMELQAGTIRAAVPIEIQATELGRRPDDKKWDEIVDDPGSIDRGGIVMCYIDRDCWSSDEMLSLINWRMSRGNVSKAYLRIPKQLGEWPKGTALKEIRPGSEMLVEVPIWIPNPDAAIRKMYRPGELPNEDWFRRYLTYRHQMLLELIAAAWRYLATAPPEAHHGRIENLVRTMQKYMESQGIDVDGGKGPQEPTLRAVAKKIVRQWDNPNSTSSVLVSSDPGIKS